jgi:hypothetical protein
LIQFQLNRAIPVIIVGLEALYMETGHDFDFTICETPRFSTGVMATAVTSFAPHVVTVSVVSKCFLIGHLGSSHQQAAGHQEENNGQSLLS